MPYKLCANFYNNKGIYLILKLFEEHRTKKNQSVFVRETLDI